MVNKPVAIDCCQSTPFGKTFRLLLDAESLPLCFGPRSPDFLFDSHFDSMRKKKSGLAGLFVGLILNLGFSEAVSAATLFPNRARGWNKIPMIVVSGKEGDPRIQLVHDAIDFWNKQLAEIGSGFRLARLISPKRSYRLRSWQR